MTFDGELQVIFDAGIIAGAEREYQTVVDIGRACRLGGGGCVIFFSGIIRRDFKQLFGGVGCTDEDNIFYALKQLCGNVVVGDFCAKGSIMAISKPTAIAW